MTDYDTFIEGGAEFPLTTDLDNSFLKDSDPTVYYALEFFESVLNTHLLPRLSRESRRHNGKDIASCAVSKMWVDPEPHLDAKDLKFPLLAVFRKRDEIAGQTVHFEKSTCTLNVVWSLPPLLGVLAQQLNPALHAAARILNRTATRGFDPAYASGANVWGLAGAQSAGFTSFEYGTFEAAGQVAGVHQALIGTLVVVEREMPIDDTFEALGSIGLEVGANDSDTDPLVTDDVEADVTF